MNLQIGDILTHILARSSYFYEPLNQTGFGPKSADLIAASLSGRQRHPTIMIAGGGILGHLLHEISGQIVVGNSIGCSNKLDFIDITLIHTAWHRLKPNTSTPRVWQVV